MVISPLRIGLWEPFQMAFFLMAYKYTSWVVSNIFAMFIPIPGEMIQFDDHIFQIGWLKPPN